jgi:hypothetical protein
MPLTSLYKAELDRLHCESADFEAKYADARYNDIPKAELAVQRERDKVLWATGYAAACANSPEHGELYDLISRCSLNTVDQARCDELWRKVFPLALEPATARTNPSLAA